jgi:hypothetical protein
VLAHTVQVPVQYGPQTGSIQTSVQLTELIFAVLIIVQEFAVIVTGSVISA